MSDASIDRHRAGRADLHIHPGGDRSVREASPRRFLSALERSGLDLAALTDHDRIDFARQLISESRDRGLRVELLLGEEISTLDGHLLGLGLSSFVPPNRPLADTIAAVHDQGALAIVAHPMLPTRISVHARALAELADGNARYRPDALEGFNPMASWIPFHGRRVTAFARRHGYPLVGGSDGHRAGHIGRGHTAFPGTTFEDLRRAIARGDVEGQGRPFDPPDVLVGIIGQVVQGTVRPGRG
jgi:predicted metal-dependent phosphoesterase TrpH